MWLTKKPATDASNPIASHVNLHEHFLQKWAAWWHHCFDQGKASYQNAEVSFAASENLTIMLALHASSSICCVTQAFAVSQQ